MRSKTFTANNIKEFLLRQKIATMPELQTALGSRVNMTVIRKLQELSYHSSYSHKGKYYTLDEIADFDSQGLWSFESVLFSRYGTFRSRYLAFAIVPKQAVYTRIATILQNNLTLIFINIQINYNLKNFVLINI